MTDPRADADPHARYVSPLAERNASPEMQAVWSPRRKFGTWRRIWLALAEAEKELGLPITDEQVRELRSRLELTDDDFRRAGEHEQRLRHDVMAHIHALGEVAPGARAIIHLGATSQDVNCNADILQARDALGLVSVKCAGVVDALARFAQAHRATPCLAFTHGQPAQPTTIGKRAATWAQDVALSLERIEALASGLRPRGLKGATGTQASFLALFDGDASKVRALDRLFCAKLGFDPDRRLGVTGQTYPRVVDSFILNELASLAAALHKLCNDVRLLAGAGEMDEPFGAAQVGSSAMPYKRNPMRCERATGLCRFVMSAAQNALNTASTQWFERTLDDSSNRRLALPESFLAIDGALDLLRNVADGLEVHGAVVRSRLMNEMPFLATEALMMAAVRLGRDRQEVHEAIRQHALAAARRVKNDGLPNDLIERLKGEPLLSGVDVSAALEPSKHVGLAAQQVDEFIAQVVEPMRKRYAGRLAPAPEPRV